MTAKILSVTYLLLFLISCGYSAQRNFLDRFNIFRILKELIESEVTFTFSYPKASYEFTKNLAITKILPSTNQKIFSCSSSPSLPTGITLHSNCEISGTPSVESSFVNYTIRAISENGKDASFVLGIVVTTASPSNLQYPTNSLIFTVGVPIPSQTPTYLGTITNCTSSPILPSGLMLSSTCEISGTPTATQSITQYTITGSNPYGDTSTTIQISVTADPPSGLSYTSSPFIFSLGIMITPQVPSLVGVATSCTASPPLPSGLNLDSATCTLSGTPIALQSFTSHTITASNPYGSTTSTIGITVNHVPPSSLSYPSGSYSLTENLAISPITPTYSGTVTNCVVTPPLPTGLTLNTSNCEITGTPTVLQSATTYTITASNTGGSTSTSLSIAVVIAPPSALSYTPSSFTFTENLSISPVTPTYSGTITNCVATPSLPTGLILNTSNCQITGTPTTVQSPVNYTITASNSSGSTTSNITIAINLAPPSALNYAGNPYTFTEGVTITPVVPTYTGTVTSCTSSPALPTGLAINNTTCAITGTPTTSQFATNYTITAGNMSGSTTFTLTITINIAPPSALNYAGNPYTFTEGITITPVVPTYTGTVTSCTSSPALPTGLAIHNTTCAITGTPTELVTAEEYTITASNMSGSTTFTLTITVNLAPPSGLTYSGSPYTFTENVTITPVVPSVTGTVESCSSSPSLPTGLSINPTTCVITGTPTVVQSATSYTITASNTSGSTNASISITVNLAPPSISYSGSPFTLTLDAFVSGITPTIIGSVTSCSISPSLPTGLSLNTTTCVISGTPTVTSTATTYTITAINGAGSGDTSIILSVAGLPPSGLTYAGNPFSLPRTIPTTLVPSVTGTVTSCSVSPALPSGLSLNTSNCNISGTPTTNQSATNYTVTASNAYGSTDTTITISIVHPGTIYTAIYDATFKRAKRYNNAFSLIGSSITDMGTTGRSFAVAIDKTRNILYVAESTCTTEKTIQVFDNANTNPGTTPSRTFTHADMVCVAALVVDEANDRLYIAANYTAASASVNRKIFRLNNASTASGTLTLGANFRKFNVSAFDSSVQGIRRATLWGDSFYVCDYGQNKIFVFDSISTYANGANLTPDRTINVIGGPAGVAIDTANNLLFVSAFSENKIKVFANASTVTGTPTPVREITSTGNFDGTGGIAYVPSLNRLYVTSFNNGMIFYFNSANTLDGNITPNASLSGFAKVSDIGVDLTR